MQRVAVVGPGGAGKTTFARELARRTDLPLIHLDRHYWKPGWVATLPEQWRARQRELLDGERWIADGNYGATFDIRFGRADTVVVLAPPRLRCAWRVLVRALRLRGQDLQAAGCPERLNLAFLWWVWRWPIRSRPRLHAALARHPHLRVFELATTREVAAFLNDVR